MCEVYQAKYKIFNDYLEHNLIYELEMPSDSSIKPTLGITSEMFARDAYLRPILRLISPLAELITRKTLECTVNTQNWSVFFLIK